MNPPHFPKKYGDKGPREWFREQSRMSQESDYRHAARQLLQFIKVEVGNGKKTPRLISEPDQKYIGIVSNIGFISRDYMVQFNAWVGNKIAYPQEAINFLKCVADLGTAEALSRFAPSSKVAVAPSPITSISIRRPRGRPPINDKTLIEWIHNRSFITDSKMLKRELSKLIAEEFSVLNKPSKNPTGWGRVERVLKGSELTWLPQQGKWSVRVSWPDLPHSPQK